MKSLLIGILVIVALSILVIALGIEPQGTKPVAITNFEDCVAAGNPVAESYPRQCRTPDGKSFAENIGNELAKQDSIRITSPRPNKVIESPLTITGEARGTWFFEASFPVVLTDWDGNIIASHYIMTADDWMTEDFVPFSGELVFEAPDVSVSNRGALILQKDNPSGLPEHDDALEIPIRFSDEASGAGPVIKDNCIIAGCSSQVCSDEPVSTTCEYRAEYACYKEDFAVCERQANGECGWTENPELLFCVTDNPDSFDE